MLSHLPDFNIVKGVVELCRYRSLSLARRRQLRAAQRAVNALPLDPLTRHPELVTAIGTLDLLLAHRTFSKTKNAQPLGAHWRKQLGVQRRTIQF
jgi:hypothetical protein